MAQVKAHFPWTARTLEIFKELGATYEAYELDFEARREVATASNLGAICGVSPYRNMQTVLKRAVRPDATPQTAAMKKGLYMEPFLVESYLEKILQELRWASKTGQLHFTMGEFKKDSCGLMGASFDLIIYLDGKPFGSVDFKTSKHEWGREVPIDYLYQVRLQLRILGLDEGGLWVMFKDSGEDQFYQVIAANEEFWAQDVMPHVRKYDEYLQMESISTEDMPPKAVVASEPPEETSSKRKTWKARVVDAKLVPPEWCIPDQKRLNQHARMLHERASVPGVEFTCD